MNRRTYLAGASSAFIASVAGCSSLPSGAPGEQEQPSLPPYSSHLPATTLSTESLYYSYLDWEALADFPETDATETATRTETETVSDDPASDLFIGPIFGSLFSISLGLGFGLVQYGDFGEKLQKDLNADVDNADETPISTILFLPEAAVVTGDFDVNAYADALPDSFQPGDSRAGYSIYEGEPEDGGTPAVAIGEDGLIIPVGTDDGEYDGLEAVTHLLDVSAGDGDRLADESTDADWTLRQAGNHGFVFGGKRDTTTEEDEGESDYDPAAGVLDNLTPELAVSGASIDASGGEVTGASADYALYHTGEPVEKSAVSDEYAGSSGDVSVTVSDGETENAQRIAVSATFTDPTLRTPNN